MGCGRSGTSLVAGMLAGAGYYQGSRLLGPKVDNPNGFFEDATLNLLNEQMISSVLRFTRFRRLHQRFPSRVALESNGWMALLPPGREPTATPKQQEAIQAWVAHTPYAYKDPRFSYTYRLWRPYLGDALRIVTYREPGTVCRSIQRFFERRRLRYSSDYLFTLWRTMNERLLHDAADEADWLFVSYDALLDGGAIDALEGALGAQLERGLVDPSLNRSGSRNDRPAVPDDCRRLYDRLLARS